MTQLVYTPEELLRSHDCARPHEVAGHRLHGGFDAAGRYLPPRALVRGPAIEAWTAALRERGGDLLPADASLLAGVRYPSEAQQKLLLQEGLGQTFWNVLTVTGEIEGRGRVLAGMTLPELQDAVVEDVSGMAVGHLNRGLLVAHGLDEGGEPERGIGGHDVMWFALRDLAFGPVEFPAPEIPERIGRPDDERQRVPRIARRFERLVAFLQNLLLIEFRAERGFSFTERLLRDPDLFRDRRAQAEEAAEIVGRIRADEAIHVSSLRLYLGELRQLTFRTRDGGELPGRQVVDPLWEVLAHWATVEQPKLAAAQQRRVLRERILRHADGARLWERFEALGEETE
ncbi:MAG: hypothetical protein QNK03_19410 [Myxococcota bacterium]|nr:hypothetical protein [Myxococcota bacterium]